MLSEAKHLGSRVHVFAEREILRLRAQDDTETDQGLNRAPARSTNRSAMCAWER